jgi:capsular polysaccharide biosynthesis protein
MEISDYLQVIWRRLWIIVLIPALAAVAVFANLQTRPTRYVATATVAGPSLVGAPNSQYSGSYGIRGFVANFLAATNSERIVNNVSQATGVSPNAIRAGLTATQIGDAAVIDVRFETFKSQDAEPVVRGVAAETVRFLFEPQVSLAQKSADEAQKAVAEATTALATFTAQNRVVLPDQEYRIKAADLSALEQQALQAEATGDAVAAARFRTAANARRVELADLGPKVIAYQALVDRKTQATTRYNNLVQALLQARAQLDAAKLDSVITVSGTKTLSPLSDMVRYMGAAIGAGLFLSVLIVVLLEVLGRRHPLKDGRADLISAEFRTRAG